MWVAFALQKLFFQQKISAYLRINIDFNESANDIISFEQLGPDVSVGLDDELIRFCRVDCKHYWARYLL